MAKNSTRREAECTVTMRQIRIEDIPKIYALGEKLFSADTYATLYRAWDQYEIAELFFSDTEYCLVAESEGKVIGFILGTVVEKPRTGRRYGYVLWLGIARTFQRHGIADMLLKRLLRRFRRSGVHMVLADTAAENVRAIRFFSAHKFNGMQEHVYLSRNLTRGQAESE